MLHLACEVLPATAIHALPTTPWASK